MSRTLRLKPSAVSRLSWGLPDSPQRAMCALCHGALPEVPLMLWKDDGSGASLCDECAERSLIAVK